MSPRGTKLFVSGLWTFIWASGLVWLLDALQLKTDPSNFYGVPKGFLRRFSDLQSREMVIPNYFFFAGYGSAYLTPLAAHSLATCLALALGDTPEHWPPLFWSVGNAYTLRRWYS